MKQVKITLVKSTVACTRVQKATVEALGLKKIRSEVVKNLTPAIEGMIFRVQHLIKVEEVK
ncbi:MAG: 50S ribosomal protein L30 [Clostridia bacterium]|nr:50S ribosomal protein L30 [Clostridia bacterium]MBR2160740.1 50S ribosomal protein L30 [Clostridia bacterium]MBR2323389.1 50S ribosomal protein L30 [Clostridia bacterium]MBR2398157.1 50S ribosomal protein L30 [Clostridia bacterium]MBR2495822.1 50S ribosomal protein L30 [Clostridia bacterium]